MTYRNAARMAGVVTTLSALALAASLVPASAAPRGVTSDTSGTFYDPPTNIHQAGTFNPGCKNVKIKATYNVRATYWNLNVPGSDGQAFLNTNKYNLTQKWVNTKTGRWFTRSINGIYQEVSATEVAKEDVPEKLIPKGGLVGPIYRFEAVDAGNPIQKITTSKGRTVVMDVGVVYYETLFDTLGDHQPGGTELKVKVVKTTGDGDKDRNLCKIAKRLTS